MYVVNQPNDQITKNIKSIMASIFSHIFFTSPSFLYFSCIIFPLLLYLFLYLVFRKDIAMNFIKSILTRENITLFLSIFGSIGALSSWIYTVMKNRKNLNIEIIGQRFSDDSCSLLVYAMFENKSRLPISITGLSVQLNSIWYPCERIPITTLTETTRCGKEILSHHEYRSMPLPIFITGLGGTSGYLYFEFPESSLPVDATTLSFLVLTNRGKAIEKKLSLGRQFD